MRVHRRLVSILLGLSSLLAASATASAEVTVAKTWFQPGEPLVFTNEGIEPVKLVLTNFQNTYIPLSDATDPDDTIVAAGESANLRDLFAAINVDTFLLYAVAPEDETINGFIGTPFVIGVRSDDRPEAPAGPIAIKVEPLRYVRIESDLGSMEAAFYYDVAPNTVANFLRLADGGFYDGLSFHRIVPGFVVQGGDPVGDGTGGPGYRIDAEFNDRPHLPGVMSMAREGDPIEQQGAPPRDRARNSAGSQFFVALDYDTTRRLDGRYTAFGRIVEGMETVQAIARLEIEDTESGKPVNPPRMTSVQVLPVTVEINPYLRLFEIGDADLQTPDTALDLGPATTQPADASEAAEEAGTGHASDSGAEGS